MTMFTKRNQDVPLPARWCDFCDSWFPFYEDHGYVFGNCARPAPEKMYEPFRAAAELQDKQDREILERRKR